MSLPFKLGKKLKFELPVSWDEITVAQFLALKKKPKNDAELFSILSGLPVEDWMNASEANIDEVILPLIEYLKDQPNLDELLPPKTITINKKELKVPKNIGLKSYGQKILLHKAIRNHTEVIPDGDGGEKEVTKDLDELIPYTLAVYFHDQLNDNGRTDPGYVDEVVPLMEQLMIVEAYPIASFFLSNLIGSSKTKKPISRLITRLRKLRQG